MWVPGRSCYRGRLGAVNDLRVHRMFEGTVGGPEVARDK